MSDGITESRRMFMKDSLMLAKNCKFYEPTNIETEGWSSKPHKCKYSKNCLAGRLNCDCM